MSFVLLDTDVFSFVFEGDLRAAAYADVCRNQILVVSFMTVAELCQWAEIRSWGQQRVSRLEGKLRSCVVLPCDIELCRIWGRIRASRRGLGRPVSAQDAWIAASAVQHQLPLITHNPSDFELIEHLQVITKAA